jgi:hypothetical protein
MKTHKLTKTRNMHPSANERLEFAAPPMLERPLMAGQTSSNAAEATKTLYAYLLSFLLSSYMFSRSTKTDNAFWLSDAYASFI